MTVDLDGLTSGQVYYCKAAATSITSDSNGWRCEGVFHLLPVLPPYSPTSKDSIIAAVVIMIIILYLLVLIGSLVLVC